MDILEAVVLGILQGLTEFIPVSSSGHLIAGHELFGTSESTLVFDVALHIGTLLALVCYFRRELMGLIKNLAAQTPLGKLARIILLATLPAALIGFFASDWIDDNLRKPETVVITMFVMGAVMLLTEKHSSQKREIDSASKKDGIIVGTFQALALIPGISRSGATIVAGMLRGLKRSDAARLSFLMAIPITAGAIVGSLLSAESVELSGKLTVFGAGVTASLASGLFAIRLLMRYLGKNSLSAFAYYRFAFAAVLLVFLMLN